MIGEVAYLRFNAFPQDPASGAAARAFLVAHANARAVIVDARPLRGGGQAVMDALLPLFYAQPATLVRMDTRAEADGGEAPSVSMVRQPSPAGIVRRDHRVEPDRNETRLQRTPLFYLTSRRTASAGEHLALALKRTHRAVLVGETTAGAGHFGWLEALPHGFAAFVPVGRTYDPDTGLDWEGRGVAPDIASPADEALNAALARIRQLDIPSATAAAVQVKP
jgi:C-terminal processing protease CtpA/Prc